MLTRRSLLLGLAAARNEPTHTVVFRSGEDGFHTFRIPALLVTATGTLLAFCEGRRNNSSDTGDIDLVLKRSTDHGASWSGLQIVADHGPDVIGNPCPVQDRKTKTIWLPLTGNPGDVPQKDILAGKDIRRIWMSRSTDDGVTWQRPVDISDTARDPSWTWCATGPGNAIQLSTGRLLVPCDRAGRESPREHSWVLYSDDRGRTWKRGGELPLGTGESQAAELPDGTVLLNCRSDEGHRRLVGRSKDGGITWTDFAPDDALVEPGCQASLIRYKKALLFSNPAAEKRVRMTVRLSRDGGRTWPHAKLLHEGPSAYSSLGVLRNGAIGCLYERGDARAYETITFARFSESWLTAA